jgi:hypothetical protein
MDGTRQRLRQRINSELPLAQATIAGAERELAKADARIAKVVRGWQDEVIGDQEYERQRVDLDSEHQAATAALQRAADHARQVETQGVTTDVEEAPLRHGADLKLLVSKTVDRAGDLEALRTVIRTLFKHVILRRSGDGDEVERAEIKAAGVGAGDGMVLIPVLREDVADWSTATQDQPVAAARRTDPFDVSKNVIPPSTARRTIGSAPFSSSVHSRLSCLP